MKEKKLARKLSLNKETIARLHNDEMKDLKGGAVSEGYLCTVGSICSAIGQCTYKYC